MARFYDPTVAPTALSMPLAARVPTLHGKVVGLLNINKAASHYFLERIAQRCDMQFQPRYFLQRTKPSSARPAPAALLQEFQQHCDLIIEALADGGSCTLCSVQDGVFFEKAGIPTVVCTTTEFVDAARVQAEALGLPTFEVLVVEHPVEPLTPQEVAQRADAVFDQLVAMLTRGLG